MVKELLKKIPLIQALLRLKKERQLSTFCLYGSIFLVSLTLIAKALNPSLQMIFLKQFHLRSTSFIQWGLLQFVPSMYNYGNEVWISIPELQQEQLIQIDSTEPPIVYLFVNHYPLRVVTFAFAREYYFDPEGFNYIYLRSGYRGLSLSSQFQVIKKPSVIFIKDISKNTD